MPNTKTTAGVLGTIDFQKVAQDVIAEYARKGLLQDAILWNQIVGLYDAALAGGRPVDPNKPDDCKPCKGTGKVKRKKPEHAMAISRAHHERKALVEDGKVLRAVESTIHGEDD